jgi:hypothetical protein
MTSCTTGKITTRTRTSAKRLKAFSGCTPTGEFRGVLSGTTRESCAYTPSCTCAIE